MQTVFEWTDLADDLTVTDERSEWPTVTVAVDYRIHPAEPDVGVGAEAEITGSVYCLDNEEYTDENAFVSALYLRIGDEIEDTVEVVQAALTRQMNVWADELEDE